ncbi:hypothetical protein A2914_00585 [Candidatus Nomurabacteria bacterium RIFCSPLOWO2_01_FULL_41_21]|uniref:HNH nuclease domain-containing protein n=2 Tax=Candidatus Nomuraibacteriota TaxID=1752729 RepID=A0A1F6V3D1_9BACT|nr:MAG: hypothetical protein A2733_02945 [Candidatus Nomurabacteria bacterium RIFCSPHIGHO2_01_FULL_40_20]OGI88337.1 MAG: hypothetical protein A2914_00585 [Candidatus Nomurabacteria bacterium RIFCSPLOWO2_01_FULL_41_21]
MPIVKCNLCSKSFFGKLSAIKKGWAKYCSSFCQYEARKKGKTLPCHICGKKTYKQVKQLTKSKSGKFFCGKSCQTVWRNQYFVGIKHHNWKTGLFVYRSLLTRHKTPKICILCKSRDRRVLAVHHIDKNRKNNKVSNLAWLCNNCHFLVHHYKDESLKFKKNLSLYRTRSKSS